MKSRFVRIAMVTMIAGSVLFSSCIGSFNLTNKVFSWNKTLGNKWVNELVFLVFSIVPVYEVALFIDAIILNSIEFWTGSNPVNAGVIQKVEGENGMMYTIETLENGYKILNADGKEISFTYEQESNIWSVVANSESTKLMQIVDNENAVVYLPNGEEMNVALNEAGLMALRVAVNNSTFVAMQ